MIRKPFFLPLISFLAISLLAGCNSTTSSDTARGAGYGAAGGAVLGLVLGATTGNGGYAAAGALAGAAAGGAAGGMYMYDQSRDDRRNQALADAIGGANKGETANQAGVRHLADFAGEWKLQIWGLDSNGNRTTASGKAKSVLTGKEELLLTYSDIRVEGFDEVLSGTSVLATQGTGFALENTFASISEVRRFVGEYVPASNIYNFYPVENVEGETITGVIRSNVRLEVSASEQLAVIKSFSLVDGKEIQIQQYTFTR